MQSSLAWELPLSQRLFLQLWQMQQLQRVLNKYRNGKITKVDATLLLKNSYGLADEDITMILSEQNFAAQPTEEQVAMMFEEIGETRSNFHVVKSMKFDEVDMDFDNFYISNDKKEFNKWYY